jgi:hypothetical protein
MVGNPQMKELEQLKGEFESSHPGITVNLLILPENEIRSKVTTDVSTGAATFDAVTIGMFEVPLFAKQGWIDELGSQLDADPTYDSNDFFKSVRDGLSYNGKLYAAPFYGESSTLFYRKDLLQAPARRSRTSPPGTRCWPPLRRRTILRVAWRASACAASRAGGRWARRSERSSTPSAGRWYDAAGTPSSRSPRRPRRSSSTSIP